MKIRRTLTVIVGIIQSMIAVLTVIFACSLYFNFFGVQTWLNAAVESHYFHILALLVFGFFSLISGLFIVHEWIESR
jgi:hypothetical protein